MAVEDEYDELLNGLNTAIDAGILQDESNQTNICKLQEVKNALKDDIERIQKNRERAKKEEEIEKRLREKRVKKIPKWVMEGRKNIHPDLILKWEDDITSWALNGKGSGKHVDLALEIMAHLKQDEPMNQVKQIFTNSVRFYSSKEDRAIIQGIIFAYSVRGPEFVEATLGRGLKPEEVEKFHQKKSENISLYGKRFEESSSDNAKEDLTGFKKR